MIKRSYRKRAQELHPDKNPADSFSLRHFQEVQEAYQVLKDTRRRQAYDRECMLHGLTATRGHEQAVTDVSLWKDLQQLHVDVHSRHAGQTEVSALIHALSYLLSDSHLHLLRGSENRQLVAAFSDEVVALLGHMPPRDRIRFLQALLPMVEDDPNRTMQLRTLIKKNDRERRLQASIPWVAVLITIIVCILMYWYGANSRQSNIGN